MMRKQAVPYLVPRSIPSPSGEAVTSTAAASDTVSKKPMVDQKCTRTIAMRDILVEQNAAAKPDRGTCHPLPISLYLSLPSTPSV